MSFLIGVPIVLAMILSPFAFFWLPGAAADLWYRLTRSRVDAVLAIHDQAEATLRDAIDLDLMDIALTTCDDCRFWNSDADRAEFLPCKTHEGLFTT